MLLICIKVQDIVYIVYCGVYIVLFYKYYTVQEL